MKETLELEGYEFRIFLEGSRASYERKCGYQGMCYETVSYWKGKGKIKRDGGNERCFEFSADRYVWTSSLEEAVFYTLDESKVVDKKKIIDLIGDYVWRQVDESDAWIFPNIKVFVPDNSELVERGVILDREGQRHFAL